MFKKYSFLSSNLLNFHSKNFNIIIILIFALRAIYVLSFNSDTGDLTFYNKIVEGLNNGCGFGVVSSDGNCSPIVGHFFPGFFYLMGFSYSLGIGVKGLVLLISIIHFLSCLNLSSKVNKFIKNKELSKAIFLLTAMSPLTFGWSRLILMEPLITTLSICFLTKFIEIFYEGFNKRNILTTIFIQIIAIYIKPTAVLFSLPFVFLIFNKLKIVSFFKLLVLWSIIISFLIMPWGIRNIYYGAKAPFTSAQESNFHPKFVNGYVFWLKSWVITEHEQAQNGFPISRYPMNLNIQKSKLNPFISNDEIDIIQEKYKDKAAFQKEDDKFFKKIAKRRQKELGLFGNSFLYSSKMISLLVNPLNSWGWPLEIKNEISEKDMNLSRSNLSIFFQRKIIISIFLKLLLFIYRTLFFIYFFKILIFSFKNNKLLLLKTNSLKSFLSFSSLIYLLGIFYLIVIKYPSLEHRYISMVIPWFEVTVLLNYFKVDKLRSKNETINLKKIKL